MGSSPSAQIKLPSNFDYFTLQIYQSNKLRLIAPPQVVKNSTRSVIEKYWGIQNIHDSPGFVEYQLTGHPWQPTPLTDVDTKLFMCTLLKQYYSIGWHVKTTTDLKYYDGIPDLIIFERYNTLQTHVICVSLNDTDKIRVVAPDTIFPHIRKVITTYWPFGILQEMPMKKSYEFQLQGNPWSEIRNDYSAILINAIFQTLYRLGFIYASAIDYGLRHYNVNSMYFKYDPSEEKKPENVHSQFFALALTNSDRLRLINPPGEMTTNISTAISSIWPKGALLINEGNGSFEFILNGFNHKLDNTTDGVETVEARTFLTNLMTLLSHYNWNLYATCILSASINDKSTLFFRFSQVKPLRTSCLTLNETDKVRLIGGDSYFMNSIRSSISRSWANGILNEMNYYGSWELQLDGHPFMNESSSNGYACFMMLTILSDLESNGFRMIASIDLSGKHSWFFADDTTVPVVNIQQQMQPTVAAVASQQQPIILHSQYPPSSAAIFHPQYSTVHHTTAWQTYN